MSTPTTHPQTWPGTAIIKSLHTPFNWRSAGMDPRPLNADVQPTERRPAHGGIRAGTSFGHPNGTMPHLNKQPDARTAKILASRPLHVAFVIPKPSAASKAARASKNKTAPMHVIRPPHSKQKKAAA